MADSTATTATASLMRDYTGDMEALRRNQFLVEQKQRNNGELPVSFDKEAVAANEKKYADQKQDITQMNFEDWLKLTVASFQNQDPMNPKDPGAVATEFATIGMTMGFSKVRGDVDKMLGVMNKGMSLSASGKVGQEVEAQFDTFKFNGKDNVKLGFDLPVSAAKVEVTVLDENAQYVHKMILRDGETIRMNGKDEIVDLSLGRNNIYWDGLKSNGTPAEAGKYTFKVRAFDTDDSLMKDPKTNKPYKLRQYVTGTLEASFIDSSNNPRVQVDGIEMPFDAVRKLSGRSETVATRGPETEHPMPRSLQQQEMWDRARAPLFERYAREEATPEVMREDIVETMRRFNLDLPRGSQVEVSERPTIRAMPSTSLNGFNESPY
jgi:flagellar basal-body rod modification protein FlgD